jgi:hypothetical protein
MFIERHTLFVDKLVFITNTVPKAVGSWNKYIGDSKAKPETNTAGFEKI